MTAECLFFDLDGPILDVSRKYHRLYADLVHARGGEPLARDEYWRLKRWRVAEREILARSGLADWAPEYQRLREARIETPEYLRYDVTWPDVREMLAELGSHYTLQLVTMRRRPERLFAQLATLGLTDLFARVLTTPSGHGGDNWNHKASLVADAHGGSRLDGWFVGDTETDIVAGRQLGLRTAAAAFGIRAPELLLDLKPDRVLGSPAELLTWGAALLAGRNG